MLQVLLCVIVPALLPSDAGGALVGPIRTAASPSDADAARARKVRRAARDGMCTSVAEDADIEAIGGAFASTYGEITPNGFSTLGEAMQLCDDDVFVDCGSGLGRTVVQAARDFGTRSAIGVEFAPSRHRLAINSLSRDGDKESDKDVRSRVRLIQGDCADEALWALPLAGATAVFASNLLFDDALNDRLRERLEDCGTIRCVAALKHWKDGLQGYGDAIEVRCETSWSIGASGFDFEAGGVQPHAGTPVYLYHRR